MKKNRKTSEDLGEENDKSLLSHELQRNLQIKKKKNLQI